MQDQLFASEPAPLHQDPQPSRLKGKRIAIAGGTTGIGRATALMLAAEGAKLFVVGRRAGRVDEVARQSDGAIGGTTADLATQEGIEYFFAQAAAALGGIDVAIMAAGLPGGGLADMSAKDIRYMLDVNFTAGVMGAKAAYEHMDEGDLVIIGSTSAHDLTPGSTVYAGAKAGLAGFAEALRRELGPKGIRVTLIEPGLTGTDIHGMDLTAERPTRMIADDEMLMPEDVAETIRFALTRPRRATIQSISIVPRNSQE
ncbi:MAG TPA: SDR family NAD(P)-dependent oxidoreductase [Sphingomicrobium sp.]|nr:SDR family NAD(P)-dependent oxidoreductase [Sphingomicrobium sp.]